MILRKPTFKNKFSSDTKINFVYLNKNSSNQTLPNLVCNEFNKALITGISQISDLSTINSISNSIKDKHMKLKKKIGIYSEKYNSSDIDEIVENKSKAFEALENLVLNDEILDDSNNNSISNSNSEINITSNNNNTRIEESNYLKKNLNNFNSTNDTQNVNTFTSKKEKKCVSVPKLDFTSIYKKYNNSELNIKEVKNIINSKKKINLNQ
jgi:hypothetical protein